jgi:hypothetical protein
MRPFKSLGNLLFVATLAILVGAVFFPHPTLPWLLNRSTDIVGLFIGASPAFGMQDRIANVVVIAGCFTFFWLIMAGAIAILKRNGMKVIFCLVLPVVSLLVFREYNPSWKFVDATAYIGLIVGTVGLLRHKSANMVMQLTNKTAQQTASPSRHR